MPEGDEVHNFPQRRAEWAALDWKSAQQNIALMINQAGFLKFEEKSLSKSNRADVMVIRSTNSHVIIGIIEVKSYNKITTKIAIDAVKQSCRYITAVYNSFKNSKKWGNKINKYFCAVVFTKDYPDILFRPRVKQFTKALPEKLVNSGLIDIISCVPENLLKQLQTKGLVEPVQETLDAYY